MVKEHHLWLPSMPRLSYFINKVPGLSHPGMLEASPSSVLSFVSFSCARGERAFKNTATFPAPCLWLHQHIELVPNRPSSKMLLLGPAEMPAKLKMTTFTYGKQNSLYQTDCTYVLPLQKPNESAIPTASFKGVVCTTHIWYAIKGNIPLRNNCKEPIKWWALSFITAATNSLGQFQEHEELMDRI